MIPGSGTGAQSQRLYNDHPIGLTQIGFSILTDYLVTVLEGWGTD